MEHRGSEIFHRITCQREVTAITDYGAFVELEPGIEGMVHISEMSWTHRVEHPSKIVISVTKFKPRY